MSELRNKLDRKRVAELEAHQKGRQLVEAPSEAPSVFRDYSLQNDADAAIKPPAGVTTPRARADRQASIKSDRAAVPTILISMQEVQAMWDKSAKEERIKHERIGEQARAERERRQAETAARAEDERKAAEVKKRRDAWYAEQEQARLKAEGDRRAQETEAALVQSEISNLMKGLSASPVEVAEVRTRLRAQGHGALNIPSLWSWTLTQLRSEV